MAENRERVKRELSDRLRRLLAGDRGAVTDTAAGIWPGNGTTCWRVSAPYPGSPGSCDPRRSVNCATPPRLVPS
ncbi:hypothetical protein [Actinosynnema sp. ALI-1.44]|uniref:hypothetical protein n=1 Tax=Actinosynnema sp. ALI-1.44 TaxID=1933779 RepID=UPI00097C5ED8|nr:hypothetical protein [Actinosynnema sp. ALI-1.44]